MELAERVAVPLRRVDALENLGDLRPLTGLQADLTRASAAMLDDGTDVLDVTQAVAQVNDRLTRRLLALGEERLGPPPRAYVWLALGSHGRGEQVLSSDQDSALAFAATVDGAQVDGAPVDRAPVDVAAYFRALAEPVVAGLALAGLPLCSGGYMATAWCRPLTVYEALFREWMDHPEPAALLRVEVFLDVRPVAGTLSSEPLERILLAGGTRGAFTVQMARAAVAFRPPSALTTLLWRGDARLDVKRHGVAAVVLLARLYALAAGSTARTTRGRIEDAAHAGVLSQAAAERLLEAYRVLTRVRLRHQIAQVQAGEPADNLVRVADVDAATRGRLRDALQTVRLLQELTTRRYPTESVT